jgi:exosortase/archaeosortase family protein
MTVTPLSAVRRRLGFCALFGLHALFMAYALDRWDTALSLPWLQAISYTTARLLQMMGMTVSLGAVPGEYAILSMQHIVFHVTRECTGVYALGLYVAAVLSYPTILAQRLKALCWGVPAFFCYSIARLVLLAVISAVAPGWSGFLHVYLLVIVNAGFLLWLWATWVNHLPDEKSL